MQLRQLKEQWDEKSNMKEKNLDTMQPEQLKEQWDEKSNMKEKNWIQCSQSN